MQNHEILSFIDITNDSWTKFTSSNTTANIFHHPEWMKLICECYGYRPFAMVLKNDQGKIRAGVPMIEVDSRLTGLRWVSLPFTDYCPPLYADESSINQFTNALLMCFDRDEKLKIEFRHKLPKHSSVWTNCDYVLHTVPLQQDDEFMLQRCHKMHKRNLVKAQKSGIRIERGNSLEHVFEYYRLHKYTRRRQGVPVQPKRFFELLSKRIIEPGLGFVLLAYKNLECIAGAIFLHWHKTLTYKYGASNDSGREYRANNLIFWTAICWGGKNGFSILDLGRTDSSNMSLRDFKSRWGAQEQPLTYSYLSPYPPRNINSRLKSIVGSIIRNSPVWVCRAMGEMLYKHFG